MEKAEIYRKSKDEITSKCDLCKNYCVNCSEFDLCMKDDTRPCKDIMKCNICRSCTDPINFNPI